ncbi:FAD-binding protein [Sulfitobacter sp. G21635-S1]|nr:FAD-linked oxidase C-terminal domain-containing protein [Sulfitobacter sp. G21635-S1]MCZ4256639.1 FAD-binding protein [Sulfitobacter sp. G21635-S1]
MLGDRFSQSLAEREAHAGTEAHHQPMPPEAVVRPVSTEEVSQIVNLCAFYGTPIVAYGNGSSLEGNASAAEGGLCIDMSLMNRVLDVRPADLDCTVEAGVTREALNEHLRETGLFFPVDPGANATLGGMTATRASGTTAVRYGTMADNVISLTVVMPDGEILRTARRARKSSAGYDLTHLFTGSEGTLGIITEVTLRLHGRPEAVRSAVCTFPDPLSASEAASVAIQIGLPLARMEYLDAGCIRAVNAFSNLEEAEADTLFLEFHGSEAGVGEQVEMFQQIAEDQGGSDFRWAAKEEDRSRLWAARHSAYTATVRQRPGARGWASDVCVPISALPGCIEHAKALLADCPVPASIMGHVGDGNFHVVFSLDPESAEEQETVARINDAMVERALECDGTCTGEHGVGLGKRKYMEREHGPALKLMRRIKAALDPDDLMNPQKIFPPERNGNA